MSTPLLHLVASVAFERLLYCFAEGTLLAAVLALGLRLIPEKSSRTRFVIWFSALLASTILPFIGLGWSGESGAIEASHPLITLPVSVIFYTFIGWLAVAFVALLRVMTGVWQLRSLRRSCVEVADGRLGAGLGTILSEFRRVREVSVLVSHHVHVPTAIGFFKPAVIVPAWMIEEGPSDELKHVVLHELAHLRRRDDWTNLIQKLVKAVLFFHPGVWWMERELSLEREMACDDAVLEQTASPHRYAECLARVAEKSFLRRQIALAQAAVSQMQHLTSRVTRILDPKRHATTQMWKPAIPGVAALALLSGIFGLWAPGLVKVEDGQQLSMSSPGDAVFNPGRVNATTPQLNPAPVRSWNAVMKARPAHSETSRSLYVPARQTSPAKVIAPSATTTKLKAKQKQPQAPAVLAQYSPKTTNAVPPAATQHEEYVLVIETRQTVTAGADGWQVSVQQLRWLVPLNRSQKQTPNKI